MFRCRAPVNWCMLWSLRCNWGGGWGLFVLWFTALRHHAPTHSTNAAVVLCLAVLVGAVAWCVPTAGSYTTAVGPWHTLQLQLTGATATGSIDNSQLFVNTALPAVSTGFVAIGTGRTCPRVLCPPFVLPCNAPLISPPLPHTPPAHWRHAHSLIITLPVYAVVARGVRS
jgi:hypothetical protein